VARRIHESLANDGKKPKLSVSIGIATYPADGGKIDSLLGAADAALYAMKDSMRSSIASHGQRPRNLAAKRDRNRFLLK
jgi:GGDEF domain-containing protein